MPVRIAIAEDQTLVLRALRTLIERDPNISVVGEARSGRELLDHVKTWHPDVVLMDLAMPALNGIDAMSALKQVAPGVPAIAISGHASEQWVVRALRAGARGYVLKTESPANLCAAIFAVHRGGSWFSPQVRERLARRPEASLDVVDAFERLTPRHREVLQLIVEGLSNREIADHLRISENTVNTHRTELMRRLGVHDVAGLVRLTYRERPFAESDAP